MVVKGGDGLECIHYMHSRELAQAAEGCCGRLTRRNRFASLGGILSRSSTVGTVVEGIMFPDKIFKRAIVI